MNPRTAICSVILSLGCLAIPGASLAQGASDNPSVTVQLNDAKAIVVKIKKDAIQMQSYAQTTGRGLQSHRTVASPWQQDAIDRITGFANDLATNMNASIDRLNKSKSRPTAPP